MEGHRFINMSMRDVFIVSILQIKIKSKLIQIIFFVTVFTVTSVPIICPSSALLVCPAVKAYISVTMGWILMKLGESVGT